MRELDAASQFPDLSWRWHDDIPILKGVYQFKMDYRGYSFQDNFNLEFVFPPNYPEKIPLVRELDSKIPSMFHRNPDGCLCLCTPVEQYLIFSKEPTLENYIYSLLNPYLLSWLWYQRFNEMPWGERHHGVKGLIESYQELLKLRNIKHTIHFMYKFVYNRIHNKQECPCGSGLLYKNCHKSIIIDIENYFPKGRLVYDFISIKEIVK